ncbi:MAG: HypC/HybG/HupF family hydrogenase formation chaperone [Candidatus Thermoplasmatota archaeon]|nr:HypC/HybG/HupF family hydrogenase formation chaperone [Candidatus Thermoplasmatota archaeon]
MCLAIPGKILSIEGPTAVVDYGEGTTRRADISLVNAAEGDYVIVHAGFAIQIVDPGEAEETLRLFREMLEGQHA